MPSDGLDLISLNRFVRRQSVIIDETTRTRLQAEAIADKLSVTQYAAKIVWVRIRQRQDYKMIAAIAYSILSISPESHAFGEVKRKAQKQPSKARVKHDRTSLSIPLPVELNVILGIYAMVYQITLNEVLTRLLVDTFSEVGMADRPHTG